MEVKNGAVKALLESGAMVRAPPIVRNWLIALLVRGDGARRTNENAAQIVPQKELTNNHK
jgi:hypothetical protein